MKIDVGFKIELNRLIETGLLVQANSGGGKSWALRKIIEEAHDKVQIILIDVEGEFASLREKYDFLLVGKEGEIPTSVKTAGVLAQRLLEMDVSTIIDLYELKPHERTMFVKRFLDALIDAPKELWHPMLLVLDEAHYFCPENGKSESAGSVIDFTARGRKRGFGRVYATQRISKLHKDAAAECNNKLIGRTGLDIDRKRASEELGFTTKAQNLSLRNLSPGEFFTFGPAISNEVEKVQIGAVKTSHPKVGARIGKIATPTPEAIKKLAGKLADLEKRADDELRTVDDYKAKIRSLTAELSAAQRQSPIPKVNVLTAATAIRDARTDGEKKGFDKGYEKGYNESIAANKSAVDRLLRGKKRFGVAVKSALDVLNGVLKQESDEPAVALTVSMKMPVHKPSSSLHQVTPSVSPVSKKPIESNDDSLSAAQTRILSALGRIEAIGINPAPKNMLAAFSEYRPTGGGFNNYLGGLRTRGYIEYPSHGMISLTKQGREAVPESLNEPATTEELQEHWRGIMGNAQEKIFNALIEVYPDSLSKEELAEKTDFSVTGGGFNNYLGGMRTMGAIDYPRPGMVRASDNAFIK